MAFLYDLKNVNTALVDQTIHNYITQRLPTCHSIYHRLNMLRSTQEVFLSSLKSEFSYFEFEQEIELWQNTIRLICLSSPRYPFL